MAEPRRSERKRKPTEKAEELEKEKRRKRNIKPTPAPIKQEATPPQETEVFSLPPFPEIPMSQEELARLEAMARMDALIAELCGPIQGTGAAVDIEFPPPMLDGKPLVDCEFPEDFAVKRDKDEDYFWSWFGEPTVERASEKLTDNDPFIGG